MTFRNKHPFFWFTAASGLVLMCAFIYSAVLIYKYGSRDRILGWEHRYDNGLFFVSSVEPDGPAAGKLRVGDQITAINGNEDFDDFHVEGGNVISIPSVDTYTVGVRRGSSVREFQLSFEECSVFINLLPLITSFLAAIASYLISLLLGFTKPEQKGPRLFALTWFAVCCVQISAALMTIYQFLTPFEMRFSHFLWLISLQPLSIATAYHAFYLFPDHVTPTRLWSSIKKFLYLFTGSCAILFTSFRLPLVVSPDEGLTWVNQNYSLYWWSERFNELVLGVGVFCICAVLVRNYQRVEEVDLKRRLRWNVYGVVLGTAPTALFFLANWLVQMRNITGVRDSIMLVRDISFLFLSLIPITVGYAVVKHRLFDIHVVVRRGVQYLFAKKVLQALIYLPVVLIVLIIRANRTKRIPDLIFENTWFLLLSAAAILLLKFRRQLLTWLDRRFFRESYNSEKLLLALIDRIKNLDSISEVSKQVSREVEVALHPKLILVFYRSPGRNDLTLGYSSGEHTSLRQIPDHSELVRFSERYLRSHDLEYLTKHGLPENEQKWLSEERVQLMVPIFSGPQRLIGMLLLGEKMSEEPYTRNDRQLLEALAAQIGMMWENLLLRERVHHDARLKHEVLAHLQEARRNLVKECPTCGRCYDSWSDVCEDDRSALELSLPVDRTLDEKYRLEKLIGKGGMGAVYRATDLRLNRSVAVKVMVGSLFGDAQALRRFEREAQASARLNHPNIITIHDFGTIGQGAYLVMEMVEGHTMRHYLREDGNIPPQTAADWFDQILNGVKAAHANGIVHRDLKPENVLIIPLPDQQNVVKILDFGLAKMKMSDASDFRSLTSPGSILGTLSYMSPEQLTGGLMDQRTDIFSIGVMVVEALTGKLPFAGKTSTEQALNIIHQGFQFDATTEEVRGLNSVLQKCLAKLSADRFSTVDEMQKVLIPAIRNCPPFLATDKHAAVHFSSVETDIQT